MLGLLGQIAWQYAKRCLVSKFGDIKKEIGQPEREPKPKQRKSRKRSGGYHGYFCTIRRDQWDRWLILQARRRVAGLESELAVLLEDRLDGLMDEWESELPDG